MKMDIQEQEMQDADKVEAEPLTPSVVEVDGKRVAGCKLPIARGDGEGAVAREQLQVAGCQLPVEEGKAVGGEQMREEEVRRTVMGSLCARSWGEGWIAVVEAAEKREQRCICGARTVSGNPCTLDPNHETGRCRFHGGFALTGAAPGNRNAVIHGLYSRRLRTCGAHCPLWTECPCAGADVKALAAAERPTCPYEQTEYDTALTDALGRAAANAPRDPMALQIAHNTALLQVMCSRAALALRNAPLVDVVTQWRGGTEQAGAYEMQASKPSAQLQAFTRLTVEYRHFAAMLQPKAARKLLVAEHLDHAARSMADTELGPDREGLLHADAAGHVNRMQGHLREAVAHAAAGREAAARESFLKADWLDNPYGVPNAERDARSSKLFAYTVKTLFQKDKRDTLGRQAATLES